MASIRRRWAALRRAVRRAGFGGNPLRRPIDRLERAAAFLALVLSVTMLPVAVTIGRAVQAQGMATAAAQLATSHPARAVLTEDSPADDTGADNAGMDGSGALPVRTAARWRLPNGSTRSGLVSAPPGTLAGTTVPIWLDNATGRPIAAPFTTDQAFWRGLLAGVGLMLAVIAVLVALLGTLRWRLNRRRYAMWAAEWTHVGPQWTIWRT